MIFLIKYNQIFDRFFILFSVNIILVKILLITFPIKQIIFCWWIWINVWFRSRIYEWTFLLSLLTLILFVRNLNWSTSFWLFCLIILFQYSLNRYFSLIVCLKIWLHLFFIVWILIFINHNWWVKRFQCTFWRIWGILIYFCHILAFLEAICEIDIKCLFVKLIDLK